jgi:hypothetical protein
MWVVTVTNPDGREIFRSELRQGRPLTVGRAAECNIMLGALTVARSHGRIELRHGRPMYFDDETSSGSRVNGQYVRGPAPLSDDQVLEIGGCSIVVRWTGTAPPDIPPPPKRPVPAESDAASSGTDRLESMLDQRIAGIRQHRQQHGEDRASRAVRFRREWEEMMVSARRLQQKLSGHERVQDFSISRDGGEISVKIRDSSPRGYSFFIVAPRHPEGKHPGFEAAWLLELGAPETFFESPERAMEELIHRLAPRLA